MTNKEKFLLLNNLTCKQCGSSFPLNGHRLYCSIECRTYARKLQKRAQMARNYENRKNGTVIPLSLKECIHCSISFFQKVNTQKFCSDSCRYDYALSLRTFKFTILKGLDI